MKRTIIYGLIAFAMTFGFATSILHPAKPTVVADSGSRTSRADFTRDAAVARDINSSLELARQ